MPFPNCLRFKVESVPKTIRYKSGVEFEADGGPGRGTNRKPGSFQKNRNSTHARFCTVAWNLLTVGRCRYGSTSGPRE